MKKVLLISLLLVTCSFGNWNQLGPEGGNLRFVCLSHLDTNTLYCLTNTVPSRCYKSTGGGDSWSAVGEIDTLTNCLFNDDFDNLYAGFSGGIYKSTNGGAAWEILAPGGTAMALAKHSTTPTTIYATGFAVDLSQQTPTFWKSTDGGNRWISTSIDTNTTGYGQAIAVDPLDSNVIYVGGSSLYKSMDGGKTFSELFSQEAITSVAIHPTNSGIIYIGGFFSFDEGIKISKDTGLTWTDADPSGFGEEITSIRFLATTPVNPDKAYAVGRGRGTITDSGPPRSFIGGHSQKWAQSNLPGNATGFDISEVNSNVYCCGNKGFYKSTSESGGWQISNTNIYETNITRIGIAPSNPSIMYAEESSTGFYKSTDYGSSWTPIIVPLFRSGANFIVHETNPNEVYAPGVKYIHKSTDGGSSWSDVEKELNEIYCMIHDHTDPSVYFACGMEFIIDPPYYCGAIAVTRNNGASWSYHYRLMNYPSRIYTIAMDPADRNILYAGGDHVQYGDEKIGMYKSIDNGSSWGRITCSGLDSSVYKLLIDPDSSIVLFAVSSSTIFKSTDAGESWLKTDFPGGRVKTIAFSGNSDTKKLFAGTHNNGVFYSQDDGASWSSMSEGLTSLKINCIETFPDSGLFVGTNGGSISRWGEIPMSVEDNVQHKGLKSPRTLSISPNPTSGKTTISYKLSTPSNVEIAVYDIQGCRVNTLVKTHAEAGTRSITWSGCDRNGKQLTAGVYFCRITTADQVSVKKLVIRK